MVVRILAVVGLLQIIFSVIFYFIYPYEVKSLALGGVISYLNFMALAYLWSQIIYKKRVAPSIALVVIKYGILIYFFTKIPKIDWIKQNDLVFGVLINPLSIVAGGFFLKNKS